MAKPGSTSAGAVAGLIIAAAVFTVTLFLNQTQSSSRLVMPMANTGDASQEAVAAADTIAR